MSGSNRRTGRLGDFFRLMPLPTFEPALLPLLSVDADERKFGNVRKLEGIADKRELIVLLRREQLPIGDEVKADHTAVEDLVY